MAEPAGMPHRPCCKPVPGQERKSMPGNNRTSCAPAVCVSGEKEGQAWVRGRVRKAAGEEVRRRVLGMFQVRA